MSIALISLLMTLQSFAAETVEEPLLVLRKYAEVQKALSTSVNPLSQQNCAPPWPPKYTNLPKAKIQNAKGKNIELSVLTPEQLKEAARWVKEDPTVPYAYINDGCYIRAHQVCNRLQAIGIRCAKKMLSCEPYDPLKPFDNNCFKVTNMLGHEIRWRYHVAPIVQVGKEQYVLDFTLDEEPMLLKDYLEKISNLKVDAKAALFFEATTKEFLWLGDDTATTQEDVRNRSYVRDALRLDCEILENKMSLKTSACYQDWVKQENWNKLDSIYNAEKNEYELRHQLYKKHFKD